jgi:hypothetical protein
MGNCLLRRASSLSQHNMNHLSSPQKRRFATEDVGLNLKGSAPKLVKALSDPFSTDPEPTAPIRPPSDPIDKPHRIKQSGVKSTPPNISPRM